MLKEIFLQIQNIKNLNKTINHGQKKINYKQT